MFKNVIAATSAALVLVSGIASAEITTTKHNQITTTKSDNTATASATTGAAFRPARPVANPGCGSTAPRFTQHPAASTSSSSSAAKSSIRR